MLYYEKVNDELKEYSDDRYEIVGKSKEKCILYDKKTDTLKETICMNVILMYILIFIKN